MKKESKKIYVGKSIIHGKGLFSRENIKRGEIVFMLSGNIVKFYPTARKVHIGNSWFGYNKNVWIDPDYPFNYLNHSCNPNLGIYGKMKFVALKNIKRGVELTFDYSTSEYDLHWGKRGIKCNCGSRVCRRHIRSIQFLPKKIFKKYLPYIPKYFQNVYLKYHEIR